MPTFYQDVEAEVDIDVEEFVDSCSGREIEKLIRYLVEDGSLPKTLTTYTQTQNLSLNDTLWYETIDIIENIAKRF
jgi:hypothetical protein